MDPKNISSHKPVSTQNSWGVYSTEHQPKVNKFKDLEKTLEANSCFYQAQQAGAYQS